MYAWLQRPVLAREVSLQMHLLAIAANDRDSSHAPTIQDLPSPRGTKVATQPNLHNMYILKVSKLNVGHIMLRR